MRLSPSSRLTRCELTLCQVARCDRPAHSRFRTRLKNGRGALAQFTLAERHMVVKKPANLSFAQGASFPLAGLTAYTALIRTGKLREGSEQRVFIVSEAGQTQGARLPTIRVHRTEEVAVSEHMPFRWVGFHQFNMACSLTGLFTSSQKHMARTSSPPPLPRPPTSCRLSTQTPHLTTDQRTLLRSWQRTTVSRQGRASISSLTRSGSRTCTTRRQSI